MADATGEDPIAFLRRQKVPFLRQFLKSRGVTIGGKRREELLELCIRAHNLDLPQERTHDDDAQHGELARTVSGRRLPHPSSLPSTWKADMRCLPQTSLVDVIEYLRTKCGWTNGRLRRYQDDRGYLLHQSGHVADMKLTALDDFTYVRGTCTPQTRLSGKPYDLWVLLTQDGEIVTGECTCTAGDGSCKHVTAMLFGICEMVQRGKTSPTDQPCQWTKSRVTSSSVPIRALQTSQATGITPHHTEYMPVACGLTPDEIRQRTLQLLISTDSDALMRTVLQPPTPAVRITPPPPVPDTRTSLQDLADKHVKAGGTRQTFVQCLPRYFTSELLLSCQQLQQGSPDWTSQRKGRITASSMYAVTRFTGRKPDGALVKQIINGSDISTPAMTFGHDNEDLARQLYLLGHQQQHPGVRVDQTGLHVDPDRPFLAASPDGLVHCPECGPGLLEVKCSFKYRDLEAQEAALQKGYHFEKQDKVISLRENSPWNYQIQCQLGVCRRTWCDLVLFTEKGILITKVIASPVVWQEIKEKGEYFFQKYVLPKMM